MILNQQSADFQPPAGGRNPHLQTLLPRLVRRRILLVPHWQRLTLPDGDFIDLAWSEDPAKARYKPRVVLFHGPEGSVNSPYAHGLLLACQQHGWLGVVMHFRGCSGEPNRLHRLYHSDETTDATFFLHWLREHRGTVLTVSVGFSLGGNMLACLMGQQGDRCLLPAGCRRHGLSTTDAGTLQSATGKGIFPTLPALLTQSAEEKCQEEADRLAGYAASGHGPTQRAENAAWF
ncbi:hydrolase [Erwinia tracheiphila PSU-1]|nr:hydrolase [Erwinia tracheiphila PSU-1]